ncbi:unnamed protein product, partial [Amoebophrya sp. A120]
PWRPPVVARARRRSSDVPRAAARGAEVAGQIARVGHLEAAHNEATLAKLKTMRRFESECGKAVGHALGVGWAGPPLKLAPRGVLSVLRARLPYPKQLGGSRLGRSSHECTKFEDYEEAQRAAPDTAARIRLLSQRRTSLRAPRSRWPRAPPVN